MNTGGNRRSEWGMVSHESIDKGQEALGPLSVVCVRNSQRSDEGRFFDADAVQESQGNRDKYNQKRNPIQQAHSKSEKGHERTKIRRMSNKVIGARIDHAMIAMNRNIDREKPPKIEDRVPTNEETAAKDTTTVRIERF